ncbi:uncharacterized protein LOC124409389 [Diprion similis]|uniref:uncharacterized protein LOC124409389 n=1 Tax=Diprion similis TaxID=362088 RepID=UPI001EF87E65|nr:uncharacterized protein LOC124409389 [Diprion similis]
MRAVISQGAATCEPSIDIPIGYTLLLATQTGDSGWLAGWLAGWLVADWSLGQGFSLSISRSILFVCVTEDRVTRSKREFFKPRPAVRVYLMLQTTTSCFEAQNLKTGYPAGEDDAVAVLGSEAERLIQPFSSYLMTLTRRSELVGYIICTPQAPIYRYM